MLMSDDCGYPIERMRGLLARIGPMRDKKALAGALLGEMGRLGIGGLQRISAAMEREIGLLPSPYRERVRPYLRDQFFGRYFRFAGPDGTGTAIAGDIRDPEQFAGYCAMLAKLADDPRSWEAVRDLPQYTGYFHLVSCYAMFVLDEPGHPAGMPFPGGFRVEKRPDGYYCPIRDKEKDVPYSICNYCPARQSELPE